MGGIYVSETFLVYFKFDLEFEMATPVDVMWFSFLYRMVSLLYDPQVIMRRPTLQCKKSNERKITLIYKSLT